MAGNVKHERRKTMARKIIEASEQMTSEITIRTNHHWRNLTYGYELTPSERADFDYIDPADFDLHDFIRYQGRVYDVDEFMASDEIAGWDGYVSDSFFSGILIRLDGDRAQIGTYFA